MNKPTKEEMLNWFDEIWRSTTIGDTWKLHKEAMRMHFVIRSLIDNMDKGPKASKEFVEGWAEHFFLAGQEAIEKGICWNTYKALIPCVEEMLTELGHEVEEKEGGGES